MRLTTNNSYGEYRDCSEIIGIRRNSVHRFGTG